MIEALREAFPAWRGKLSDDHMIDLGVLGRISETSLTRDVAIAMGDVSAPWLTLTMPTG